MRSAQRLAPFLLFFLIIALAAPLFADPPSHAPAHGWRKKHDPYYVGYSGKHWERDYGVLSGRCNREAIATVLGGVVGAVIGSEVAKPEDRTVAIIVGAAAGALIGNRIGRKLDEADRSCFGHALEVGKSGQPVAWTNEATGVEYRLTPGADRDSRGDGCREYTLMAIDGAEKSTRRGVACQSEAGIWKLVD